VPWAQSVKRKCNVPHALCTTDDGSKCGIHLPPVGISTLVIVAASPLYVPTPMNHACAVPAGLDADHAARSRGESGGDAMTRRCPLCAGSYQKPLRPAPISNGGTWISAVPLMGNPSP